MPVVTIRVAAGSLDAAKKAAMISKVTDAVVEVEGIPAVRPSVYVLIEEVQDGGWGVGGKAWPLAELQRLAATVSRK